MPCRIMLKDDKICGWGRGVWVGHRTHCGGWIT